MRRIFLVLIPLGLICSFGFYVVWIRSFSLNVDTEVKTSGGTFVMKRKIPQPRTEGGGTAIGNKLYVLGGIDSFGQTLSDFYCYDAMTDEWLRLADVPMPVNHPGVVTDGTDIYVVGGFAPLGIRIRGFMFAEWNPYESLLKYDVANGEWQSLATMPAPRGAGGAAYGLGKIWYVGGIGKDRDLSSTLFEYTLATNQWMERAPMKYERDHLRMEYVDSALYAISGRLDDLRFNLTHVERYGLIQNEWTEVAPIPTGRGGMGSVVYQNRIITYGGEGVWSCFASVDMYNPELDEWTSLGELPEARHGIVGGVIGNSIFLVSGGRYPRISISSINREFIPEL